MEGTRLVSLGGDTFCAVARTSTFAARALGLGGCDGALQAERWSAHCVEPALSLTFYLRNNSAADGVDSICAVSAICALQMKPLAWSAVVFALLAVFLQSACARKSPVHTS